MKRILLFCFIFMLLNLTESFALYQNYPNPFNPTATIEFDLPEDAKVTLKIFDILGREVCTILDNEPLDAGKQQIEFVGENIASGVYFYRIFMNSDTKTFADVKNMLLMK